MRSGAAGAPVTDPLTLAGRYGAYLYPLWGIVATLVFVASVLYAALVRRGDTAFPRWMTPLNPAVLLVIVGTLGSATPLLAAFLLPAAPNLVHAIFFALTTACPRSRRPAPASARSAST